MCEPPLAEHQEKPEAEFNDDDTYTVLAKEAVNMKNKRGPLQTSLHMFCSLR